MTKISASRLLRTQWARVLLILVCAGALAVWLYTQREQAKPLRLPAPGARVLATPVQRLDVQSVRPVTGQLQAARKATLAFEASGRVAQRLLEPGQRVAASQLLLQLEAEDYEDQLSTRQLERDMERADAERDRRLLALLNEELQLQQAQLQRMATLERQSLASQSAYDEAKRSLLRLQAEQARLQHRVDSAATRLQQRDAEYQLAARRLQRTRLTAPYAGMVSVVYAEQGDYVTVGQAAVELIQIDTLDLLVAIPARLLAHLQHGQTVAVTIDDYSPGSARRPDSTNQHGQAAALPADQHSPEVAGHPNSTSHALPAGGRQHTGEIVAIGPVPNARSHTHPLRIRVPGDGLHPGQLATAMLPGPFFPQALTVPLAAVTHEAGRAFVYRVQNGRLHKTPVQLLHRHQDLYVVAGLSEGEPIVAHDTSSLRDGQRVQIMQSAQDSSTPRP